MVFITNSSSQKFQTQEWIHLGRCIHSWRRKKKITTSFFSQFRCFYSTHLENCVPHAGRIFSSEWKFGIRQQCSMEHSNCWSFYGLFSLFVLKYLPSYDSKLLEKKNACDLLAYIMHLSSLYWDIFLIFPILFGNLGLQLCVASQLLFNKNTFINNFSTYSTQMHIFCPLAYLKIYWLVEIFLNSFLVIGTKKTVNINKWIYIILTHWYHR